MEEKPILEQAKFEFSQEPNCNSEGGAEFLEIQCMASLGLDRDKKCFFVLKTEQWSIDSIDDLKKLFDRLEKSLFDK